MWAGGVGVGEGRGPGMVLAHSLFSHALQGAGEVGTAEVGAVTELACISWEEEVLERLFILKGLHCLVVFHAWEPSVCSGWTYPSSSGWFCPDPGSRTLQQTGVWMAFVSPQMLQGRRAVSPVGGSPIAKSARGSAFTSLFLLTPRKGDSAAPANQLLSIVLFLVLYSLFCKSVLPSAPFCSFPNEDCPRYDMLTEVLSA